MVQRTPQALAELFEKDETAWLEQTAELVRGKRFDQVDSSNLAEYLTDMAKRDRREVFSRLVTLLIHLLKWEYQQDRRSTSWQTTLLEQQRELSQLLESGTLRNHAETVFAKAYAAARRHVVVETAQDPGVFPENSPWALEIALGETES